MADHPTIARKLVMCSFVKVNEYYHCLNLRRDYTNRTGDTAIRNMKEMQNPQTLSHYISFNNIARKLEFCSIVEVNEYYNCLKLRSDYTNRTGDTAIRNMKVMQNLQTLSHYISFNNIARKLELCSFVKVNEYCNCLNLRRDYTNRTGDTAIRNMKEMQNPQTLSHYISFNNIARKLELCSFVNEYYNCLNLRCDYTNRTGDTAIRNMKVMQNPQTLSHYISFNNIARKLELCSFVKDSESIFDGLGGQFTIGWFSVLCGTSQLIKPPDCKVCNGVIAQYPLKEN
uniref:Uncharacterized protein n=1 Tax=Rhodnius prolixus TaxID=13249 RepID=T1I029_RHOPR